MGKAKLAKKLVKSLSCLVAILGLSSVSLQQPANAAIVTMSQGALGNPSTHQFAAQLVQETMPTLLFVPPVLAMPLDPDALNEPWDFNVPEDQLQFEQGKQAEAEEALPDQNTLSFIKPIQNAVISSNFGARWGRMHQGVDLAAPMGTPIHSVENGTVVFSGWQSGYGNTVVVDHGSRIATRYAHASRLLVKKGQTVAQGQTIARVGSTGRSTGPHLHFEVVAHGAHRNPMDFLEHNIALVGP